MSGNDAHHEADAQNPAPIPGLPHAGTRGAQQGERSELATRTVMPAKGLTWYIESDSVVLISMDGKRVELRYPEAAVWDHLTRGTEEGRIVRLLMALTGWSPEDARVHICVTVQALLAAGCLREEMSRG